MAPNDGGPGEKGKAMTVALRRRVTDHQIDLSHGYERDLGSVVESLTSAVEAKDSDTGSHLYRSTMIARACLELIDEELADDPDVSYGFMLHDVGKIGIPDAILNKKGPLNKLEWEVMKTHPVLGAHIVEPIGFTHRTLEVIMYHHERFDGRGYPNGLKGNRIPLAARVFSVADAYDAMTTARSYRPAMRKEQALAIIQTGARSSFDPTVVDALCQIAGA